MTASYRNSLWAATSLINGGYSDDGFEYFRGWLIAQGRKVFVQSVANPETLADLPVIDPAGPRARWLECEEMFTSRGGRIRRRRARHSPLRRSPFATPELEAGREFEFDDRAKMEQRLPRLTALCWPEVTGSGAGETS
jgi:Protein of unknown function (DUF4240)